MSHDASASSSENSELLSTPPTTIAAEAARPPKTPRKGWTIAKPIVIIAAVLLLAVGFVAGLLVGRATATSSGPGGANMPQQGGPGGDGQFTPPSDSGQSDDDQSGPQGAGGITSGTIDSIDGDTLTVTTQDGSTVTVTIGSSTSITTTQEGTVDDLAAGDTVVVSGSNSDGTIDATSISEGMTGFGGGAPGAGN